MISQVDIDDFTESSRFSWAKKGGYECSSKGDKRFSAFYATMPDGRTLEQWYQCDVKGYDVGGTNWKLGKGKPSLKGQNPEELFLEYKSLWILWSKNHMEDLRDLYLKGKQFNYILSDMFANTPVNQAHALAELLNDLIRRGKNGYE